MARIVSGWVAALGWVVACGHSMINEGDEPPDERPRVTLPPRVVRGPVGEGGGDAGLGGQPSDAGTGGLGGEAALVSNLAEQGLSEADVELEPLALADRSYVLESKLCPDEWDEGEQFLGTGGARGGHGMATLHVRASKNGALEAVTYTSAGGEPLVEVHAMRRSGLGWDISLVKTCARLLLTDGEDWHYDTFRYTARRAHLVFLKTSGSETTLRMVVSGEQGPLASDAGPDSAPPRLERIDRSGDVVDGYEETEQERYFAFSEPLAPNSRVFIRDSLGEEVDVEYLLSENYAIGYTLRLDVLDTSHTPKVLGQVQDLAGNPLVFEQPY